MKDYHPETYGDTVAEVYDDWYSSPEKACVDFLSKLGKNKRVLELGIGTGRIALLLKNRGIDIHGIDSSRAMVEKLMRNTAGSTIPVTIGDFASVPVKRSFDVIFVAFNTFFMLTTQEAQLRCMKSVRRRLTSKGCFILEAFVPNLRQFMEWQNPRIRKVETGQIVLDISSHDPLLQQIANQRIMISESGIRMYPSLMRYAGPSELDMMAQAAGLKLLSRWADWQKKPVSAESVRHISIYGRD